MNSIFYVLQLVLGWYSSEGSPSDLLIVECDVKGVVRTITHEQVLWNIRASHLDSDFWVVMWETQEGEAFVRIRDLHSHEEVVVNLIRPLVSISIPVRID